MHVGITRDGRPAARFLETITKVRTRMKNTEGGFGVELARIGERDAARADALSSKKERTRRRRGNKGSRVWGYQTGGTRKGGNR